MCVLCPILPPLSLPPFLPPSLPSSFPPSLPLSLPPSFPPSLPPSLSPTSFLLMQTFTLCTIYGALQNFPVVCDYFCEEHLYFTCPCAHACLPSLSLCSISATFTHIILLYLRRLVSISITYHIVYCDHGGLYARYYILLRMYNIVVRTYIQ